jgi:hypothetical protein
LIAVAALSVLTCVCLAQVGDGSDQQAATDDGDRCRRQPPCQREGGPPPHPPHPVMMALDADRDGELSADEISSAATALLTLDQNADGVLTRDELRPPPPPRGEDLVEHIMSHDADGDGSVSADELPQQMQRLMKRADADQDGLISESEAQQFAETAPPPRRGGKRPHRGCRPEGNPEAEMDQ